MLYTQVHTLKKNELKKPSLRTPGETGFLKCIFKNFFVVAVWMLIAATQVEFPVVDNTLSESLWPVMTSSCLLASFLTQTKKKENNMKWYFLSEGNLLFGLECFIWPLKISWDKKHFWILPPPASVLNLNMLSIRLSVGNVCKYKRSLRSKR